MAVKRGAIILLGIAAIVSASAQPIRADNGAFVVARRTIYPGATISSSMIDVRPVRADAALRAQMFIAPDEVEGKVAKNTFIVGQPLVRHGLRAGFVVQSGRPVTMTYDAGELSISAKGLAMQSGEVGASIAVQNTESKVVVRGIVMPDGTVRLND